MCSDPTGVWGSTWTHWTFSSGWWWFWLVAATKRSKTRDGFCSTFYVPLSWNSHIYLSQHKLVLSFRYKSLCGLVDKQKRFAGDCTLICLLQVRTTNWCEGCFEMEPFNFGSWFRFFLKVAHLFFVVVLFVFLFISFRIQV